MKRLGILSIYDKEGIIDEYIIYLGQALKQMLDKFIVVINGQIQETEYEKLERLSENIVVRDNCGFDAGAYKEVLRDYIGREKIHEYDELVICNDTCYGPFIDFQKIWDKMDGTEADFWGLNFINNGLTNHMQGYFLVFRKTLIESEVVYDYFEECINEKCTDLQEIIASYEKGLFKHLIEKGFKCANYIECNNLNMYKYGNTLVSEYGFPFLKKKCFSSRHNENINSAIDALAWIKKNTTYDISMILENVRRVYGVVIDRDKIESNRDYSVSKTEALTFKINKELLEEFIKKEDEIYIYGCGKYAKEMYFLYLRTTKKLKGFVVSDNQEIEERDFYGYPIVKISQLEADKALIVALNDKNTEEVRKYITQKNVIFLF